MHEIKKQNIVKGYTLSRMTPLNKEDKEGFNKLNSMLKNIDPCLELEETESSLGSSLESFKQFYYDTFGTPGTVEFENKIKEINERITRDNNA